MNVPSIKSFLEELNKNGKEIKDFDNIVNLAASWNRHLVIGEIDEDLGNAVEVSIRFYNQMDDEENIPIEERKPILIFINSPGGSLDATFTMIDAIKMSKTPVYTINIGCAYSGGFFTFIAGHKRFAYPQSSFLFHEGAVNMGGDAGKFQNFSSFYKRQLELLKKLVL
jgi:ATP-dependent Clp protease protease subunit